MGSGLEQYWQQMVQGRGGLLAGALQKLLLPLSWAYGAAAVAARSVYDLGLRKPAEPALPVISVGNLAMGGTGKTTVAAFLALRLQAAGARPAIILRGYRAEPGPHPVVLDHHSSSELLDQAGDEALLLARRCPGVPVLVCKQREAAVARAAEPAARPHRRPGPA
ncbi:MAG: tetraacyldisaccharide 4'-kinase, partial [Armatimonadetes bacterium]|nr:tetraacyldisaccharide 4'-kinase [Armatimonadota bacterium]